MRNLWHLRYTNLMIFDYNKMKLEDLPCNLCGADDFKTISQRDRYGFSVNTALCRKCGLIFINPRMGSAEYDNFYQSAYRTILEKYHGVRGKKDSQNLDVVFESGRGRGEFLASIFGEHLKAGSTLEVGSSTGGILSGFREKLKERYQKDFDVLGMEPSEEEAAYALKRNIPTHITLFENFSGNLPKIENIIIARSLNHLLDPKSFFDWSYKTLPFGGHLIAMVLNFPEFCRNRGKIETQVDHPFMFADATLKNFARVSGFRISLLVSKGIYLYLLAEKTRVSNSKTHISDYDNALKNLNPFILGAGYYFRKFKTFVRHKIKK